MNRRGSALVDTLLFAFITVFVTLPLFAGVVEGYLILNRTQVLRDSVDMASVSSYNALNGRNLGKTCMSVTGEELEGIWCGYLAANLKLEEDLSPKEGSIIDGKAEVLELEAYMDGLPVACSRGTIITRPAIHCVVTFPVRPSLFGRTILRLAGREYIYLTVHVDSELPMNNPE